MANTISAKGTYVQKYMPVPVSAPAYAAGDVVGGLLAVDVRMPAEGGFLEDILFYDKGNVAADLTVYVFDGAPTSILDSAAFALSDADLNKLILQGTVSNWTVPVSGNSYARFSDFFQRPSIGQFFVGKTLWVYLVAVGTPDYAVGDLAMKVQVRS